ncbi:MAG: pyridoxamine 5'-phosphate oxidase family protein [Eggerthellaceae bacterium]
MTNTAAYEALEEIVDYLTGIPAWFLATTDESDTQPRVWPSFRCRRTRKLWFSTSRDKDVYRELARNPT